MDLPETPERNVKVPLFKGFGRSSMANLTQAQLLKI